jgi:hypothetical protein
MPHHSILERRPAAPIPPLAALPTLGMGSPLCALVSIRAQAIYQYAPNPAMQSERVVW